MGLRPEDCKFSGNGCRYVVEDLATGHQGSSVGSTGIGAAVECWQASDYRAESVAAGDAAGIDPRMVYAIFHRESKCPRGPLADQVLHECWLWGKCAYPSLGPTNFDKHALKATLANQPELWDAMPYLDPQEDANNVGAFAWLLMDTGDRAAHASFAAQATAYRLADLNTELNRLIAKHRISAITLATFERKRSEEPDSFFLFRSSLLGLGWFGGGQMRDGRTIEQGVYRMEQALTGAGYVKANVSGSSQCYVNVYGQ